MIKEIMKAVIGPIIGGGSGSQTYTDGTHTVTGVTQLTVTGGTIGGTTPNATLAVSAGSSGVTFTDGTNTVSGSTQLTVSGGTIGGTTPNATLSVSGGGSNTITLTADTNIAAGTAVAINSSGHAVQTWGPAPNVAGLVSLGYQSAQVAAAILQLSASLFIAFLPEGGGAVACTISGSTITVGTLNTSSPLTLITWTSAAANGPNASLASAAALSATSFAVAYQSADNHTYTAVGTVSGTTITMGTPVEVDAAVPYNNGWACFCVLASTHYLLMYSSNSGVTDIVSVTTSGTTATVGTPVPLASSLPLNTQGGILFTVSSTEAIALYTDPNNNNLLTAQMVGVSANVITLGTLVVSSDIGSQSAGPFSAAQISTSAIAVVGAYAASPYGTFNASGVGALGLVSISGTTPSFGTIVKVPGVPTLAVLDATHVVVAPSSSPNATLFSPQVYTLSGGVFSGPSFSKSEYFAFGQVAVQSSSSFMFTAASEISNNPIGTFLIAQGDGSANLSPPILHQGYVGYWLYPVDSTHALAILLDTSGLLSARIINVEAIASAPIGFVSSAVTSGNPATVDLSGSISGFSGLTVGTQYYVNGDGTLTTGDTGWLAGIATSSTTLVSQGIQGTF